MMFSEISKLLFSTDNNYYCSILNWIPKQRLLLIFNEPFLFFVSDNEEANQMKSYFHLRKSMSKNEAQHTKNAARTRNGTARARDEERVSRNDKAGKKQNMTL